MGNDSFAVSLFCFVFTNKKGLLVTGAYIAMASDECVRAVCMYLRWKSGRWREKGFVKTEKFAIGKTDSQLSES